jgi:hypothetical protein
MSGYPEEKDSSMRLQFATALASEVVPEEAPFLVELVQAAQSPRKRRKDHALGFGVSAAEVGSTCLVLYALSKPVLAFLWDNSKAELGQAVAEYSHTARLALEARLKEWFKSGFHGTRPITLPQEQLESLINTVSHDAKEMGLKERELQLLTTTLDRAFR